MWINRHDIVTVFDTHKDAVDYQSGLNHENGWRSRVDSYYSQGLFVVRHCPKYVMPAFYRGRNVETSGPYAGSRCDEVVGF